ncbi:hypothetical protein GALMADRAFT_145907 [Galerina marginata CBS 339.88]|uniref:Uncharacterized protein n=1 Tax=Galerina marginata (strain CBS 339.88) TaxID=685588 RepID=A0A067SQ20_GALM3|nr:hypothetical protein GALMADRAFT_145907 [Galerina marginata CBS 339.88]
MAVDTNTTRKRKTKTKLGFNSQWKKLPIELDLELGSTPHASTFNVQHPSRSRTCPCYTTTLYGLDQFPSPPKLDEDRGVRWVTFAPSPSPSHVLEHPRRRSWVLLTHRPLCSPALLRFAHSSWTVAWVWVVLSHTLVRGVRTKPTSPSYPPYAWFSSNEPS